MTTLYVPLHLPAVQAQRFLDRELKYRTVESIKIHDHEMVIQHRRATVEEILND